MSFSGTLKAGGRHAVMDGFNGVNGMSQHARILSPLVFSELLLDACHIPHTCH